MKDKEIKIVRFNCNLQVHEVIHRADFTKKEIFENWYTQEETLHILDLSVPTSMDECFRGSEDMSSSNIRKHRKKRIKKAILNVINEQDRQKVFGYNDIQKIALINKKANGLARAKALELGKMDYNYVQKKVRCECNLEFVDMLPVTDENESYITNAVFTKIDEKRQETVRCECNL